MPLRSSERSRLELLERESPFHNPSWSFRAELQPERASAEPDEPAELEDEAPLDRPDDAPKLPSNAALKDALAKSPNKAIRELAKVMTLLGKPDAFGPALLGALSRIPWEGEPAAGTARMALARLGVEAFLQGTPIPADDVNLLNAGFVHHPTKLGNASSPTQRQYFVHFAVEALRVRSKTALTPTLRRRELESAAALFHWVAADVAAQWSTSGISEPLLVAYRRLLVTVIWKHYHALQDGIAAEMRRSPKAAPELVKTLRGHFAVTATTNVRDEKATVPTYRTKDQVYRDYFEPAPATDIAYRHYTSGPLPMALKEFDTPFEQVVRIASLQYRFIEGIAQISGARPIPTLADSVSWQAWLRTMWNETWSGLPVFQRLGKAMDVVKEHVRAFTIHVPFDLREGCAVPSYLTRQFPRAVTGGQAHDCAVYAVRWLHMLGGLVGTKAHVKGIAKARTFLIDMPAHVGAMIRIEGTEGKKMLIAINNDDATLSIEDAMAPGDNEQAEEVVAGMYPLLETPFRLHPIAADPADAGSLWKATCAILGTKLELPYGGPAEPHLRYLEFNRAIAELSDKLAARARTLGETLRRELAQSPAGPAVAKKVKELLATLSAACREIDGEYKKDVEPLIKTIREDLARNRSLLPKTVKDEGKMDMPWKKALDRYKARAKRAAELGELPVPDPEDSFPDSHFPTAG